MKTCSNCGETKPIDQFQKAPRNGDGHGGLCMDCWRIYKRDYYRLKQMSKGKIIRKYTKKEVRHDKTD